MSLSKILSPSGRFWDFCVQYIVTIFYKVWHLVVVHWILYCMSYFTSCCNWFSYLLLVFLHYIFWVLFHVITLVLLNTGYLEVEVKVHIPLLVKILHIIMFIPTQSVSIKFNLNSCYILIICMT